MAYWSGRRFSAEVIASFDQALTQLKANSGARKLQLVGYSGGGVIAVLLGMRRDDVQRVVTVASPLALNDWVAWHKLSPLADSLDPTRQTDTRPMLNGVHFVGTRDRIVPAAIVERFVRTNGGRVETVAGFDHDCCWVRHWPRLLARSHDLEAAP